tara:strand:- start:8858 stop:9256 length:399 start_codon:yes stop_codon:yes gene_type:complete
VESGIGGARELLERQMERRQPWARRGGEAHVVSSGRSAGMRSGDGRMSGEHAKKRRCAAGDCIAPSSSVRSQEASITPCILLHQHQQQLADARRSDSDRRQHPAVAVAVAVAVPRLLPIVGRVLMLARRTAL